MYDKHWVVEKRFEEDQKDGEKRTVLNIEMIRNEIKIHVMHEFVAFRLRRWGEDDGVSWMDLLCSWHD